MNLPSVEDYEVVDYDFESEEWKLISGQNKWYPKGIRTYVLPMFIQMMAVTACVKQVFPPGYRYLVSTYEDMYVRAGYFIEDFEILSSRILQRTEEDEGWFDSYLEEFRIHSKKLKKFSKTLRKKKHENKNEWIQDFKKLVESALKPQAYGYLTEVFDDFGQEYWVSKELLRIEPGLTDEEIQVLLSPSHESFFKEYEKLLSDGNFEEALDDYYWIKGSYYRMPELTIADLRKDKDEIENNSNKKNMKSGIIEKSENSEKLEQFVNFVDSCIKMQDERKENILITNYAIKDLAENLSSLTGLDFEIIMNCIPLETLQIAEGELSDDFEKIIEKRKAESAWIFRQDDYFISSDDEALSNVFSLLKVDSQSIVNGTVACSGMAKGKVKVVISEDDFNDFEDGDILVTSMTRPEFLPVMKKSAAIVTDEGGVTCHAAIVSRELNKPCVIGTQTATSSFSDGDRVEVDANKGVVRKIG